jgi:hypothetical protein
VSLQLVPLQQLLRQDPRRALWLLLRAALQSLPLRLLLPRRCASSRQERKQQLYPQQKPQRGRL